MKSPSKRKARERCSRSRPREGRIQAGYAHPRPIYPRNQLGKIHTHRRRFWSPIYQKGRRRTSIHHPRRQWLRVYNRLERRVILRHYTGLGLSETKNPPFNARRCRKGARTIPAPTTDSRRILPIPLHQNKLRSQATNDQNRRNKTHHTKRNTIPTEVVGTFLDYARAIDSTMLRSLGTLAAQQQNGTEQTMEALTQFLNYAATNPDAVIAFQARRYKQGGFFYRAFRRLQIKSQCRIRTPPLRF
jgi:hypothetical protein